MKRLYSAAEIALTATAVAITGGTAYLLTTRKSGVLTGTYANPLPVPSSDAAARRVPAVAERFRRIWPEVTGEKEMSPQALEIALSQAWLESGVAEAGGGGWWTDKTDKGQGNMVGSGNLGARQCSKPTDSGDYYTCVPYGDTVPQPDGSSKVIDASFMYFKTGKTPDGVERDAGDAAAWRFLTDVTKTWPALAELKSGDVMAYAKRQGPKAQGGNGYYQGFGATMDERVAGYARAIASHIPAVAAALGHKKVYSKILPELLASGTSHKPVAGTQLAGAEIAQALHIAGVLPRARAIPGSRGHIVWYIERPELGAGPPRDVVITEEEAIEQDKAMREAGDFPEVEGAGTIVLVTLSGILVAMGIAAAVARKRATEILGKIRSAGYDIALPKGPATSERVTKQGWVIVEPMDPAFGKIRSILGDELFGRALAAGIVFQRPATMSGYRSSRWARSAPPVGDLAEDILKFGKSTLDTINANLPAPTAQQPAPAPAPQVPPVATPAPSQPAVSSAVANVAVAAGAAAAVLLAVALAWRIAKPGLGDAAPVYPRFVWMNGLPDAVVDTLRSGIPLSEEQVKDITIGQCETIVDHALLVSINGVPDPSTWILLGDGRIALGGIAEAVQAASLAVVGVVALVAAISLHRFLTSATGTKDLSDAAKKAGAFTGLTDPFKHEFTSPAGQKCTQEIGPLKTTTECAPVSEPEEMKKRSRTERISWLLDNAGDPGDILKALQSAGPDDSDVDLRAFLAAATHQATVAHLVLKGSHSWDNKDAAYQNIMLWWADRRGEARSKAAAADKNWRALVGIAADFCEFRDSNDRNCPLLRSYEKTGDVPVSDDSSIPWWHPVRWLAGVEPQKEPRWLRWLNPDVGDAQTDAAAGKKAVDAIADRYASKNAAHVVGSTTGGVLTGLSIGAALGTAFPGIGNVVGAAVGAVIGALAGLISGILSLGPSPEQIALAEEINKFNTQVHTALATVPIDARTKIGMILLDGMRKRPGNIPLCVGPGAEGRDMGCVMTSIEGIRDAAVGLDDNVKKWILEYEQEQQAKRTRMYKQIAVAATGITLAALAAVAVAAKTGMVAIGDAEPVYPEFQWMVGFPADAVATLRAGTPLGSAALRKLTRDQRRILATHASLTTRDGAIDPASWKITE